jgi:hypothetical protein
VAREEEPLAAQPEGQGGCWRPSGRCGGGGEEECERAAGRQGSDGIEKKNKGIIDISSSLYTRKNYLLNAATSPLLKLLQELKKKILHW